MNVMFFEKKERDGIIFLISLTVAALQHIFSTLAENIDKAEIKTLAQQYGIQ